jgi:hypothetical protein
MAWNLTTRASRSRERESMELRDAILAVVMALGVVLVLVVLFYVGA